VTVIELVYFNAGGGHRAAATALVEVIALRGDPWQVRRSNLVDLLDPLGHFERVVGFAPEEVYNQRLARGWTLGLGQELKVLQALIRLGHKQMVKRLEEHWRHTRPQLVVSLIPNFNLALQDSVQRALPGTAFVTILTDMADHPPNFWMEPPRGQHVVCGTSRAVDQARAMGYADMNIHRTSGMIIRPDFYTPPVSDRAADLERLGLRACAPVGVVMFGGQGSMSMLKIARSLPDMQLILMCGRNSKLACALRAQRSTAPRAVVEFTPEVRRYLQLADFFIGKPGPASLAEAVCAGLPIVTIRNAWTMPQERFNAEWVKENKLGVVTTSIRKIEPAVLEVLSRLTEFRENVRRIQNSAVFEVPAILSNVMESSAAARATRDYSSSECHQPPPSARNSATESATRAD
jgi:hypothetical protein